MCLRHFGGSWEEGGLPLVADVGKTENPQQGLENGRARGFLFIAVGTEWA